MACIELFHYLHNVFLTYDQWLQIYKRFDLELEKVHSKSEWTKAAIKCTPSFIYRLPTITEYIKCLGICLGTEQCRFTLLELKGKPKNAKITQETFKIPKHLQLTAEDDFFEFIISCLSQFAKNNGVQKLFLPLGVTYKMPINFTEKILERTTLHFDKAFRNVGPEHDEVNLLLTVSLIKNLDLEICKFVMVNQTSALLMLAIGLINPNCRLVVTEYGAAYVEAVENLDILANEHKRKGTYTIMELDWSEFADGDLLDDMLNKFDARKIRVFEHMIAAKYRCEMFQKILLSLVKNNIVFPSHANRFKFINILIKEGCFEVDDVELVEEDICPEFLNTKALLKKVFDIDDATIYDCFKVQYICQSLAKRAAQLIAVILSSWINRHNESNIVVGLDERLFRLKQRYTIIPDIMFMLVRPLLHYQIVCISDDVGIAAAITAGMSVNHNPIPY